MLEWKDLSTSTMLQIAGATTFALAFLYRTYLAGNTIEDFIRRLNENDPELTELNLAAEDVAPIGDSNTGELVTVLVRNTHLTSLDLNGMNIGDEGAEKVAYLLLLNKTLTLVRLHKNKISNTGAEALVQALRHNHTVTTLFLSTMNHIKGTKINDEIQRLVELNKKGPEEAAKQKAALFGPGWVAEGDKLQKKAEQELVNRPLKKTSSPSESIEETSPLLSSAGSGPGHKKSE